MRAVVVRWGWDGPGRELSRLTQTLQILTGLPGPRVHASVRTDQAAHLRSVRSTIFKDEE